MYHIFFIQSSADGHSGCFPVLALVNSAAVNTGKGCMYLFELQFCLGICRRVRLLDHMATLFFVFCRTSITVFHNGCTN